MDNAEIVQNLLGYCVMKFILDMDNTKIVLLKTINP